jgi:hypothetical protein
MTLTRLPQPREFVNREAGSSNHTPDKDVAPDSLALLALPALLRQFAEEFLDRVEEL